MNAPAARDRRKAYRRGLRAERLAALALMLKGYRIVAKRYQTPVGEVDLIARKGDLIALVEVKARKDVQTALDSVTHTAQKRIQNAGEWWINRQADAGQLSWRCDIVAVIPRRWPVHFENVW